MRYSRPVTPAVSSQLLIALCQEIVPGSAAPVYIDVQPLDGVPPKECFPIVEEHVSRFGGSSLIGWALWEMPTLFLEAEFHAVWKAPDNSLLDIAPKPEPTQRILFLPDPSRNYRGYQVNNVRRAVSQNADVIAFLQACDEEFEFMNRGIRAKQHGEIVIEGDEIAEYEEIRMRRARFSFQMLPEIGPYTPCPCGSGKKTKWCHGIKK